MRTEEIVIPVYAEGIIGDTTVQMSVQCLDCANLNNDMVTCKAFPEGIPTKIFNGHWDHTKSFKGDDGILFKRLR